MKYASTSRRQFLKTAGLAVAAPYVITSTALGAEGRPPASERIVMGTIGTGGQGTGDGDDSLHDYPTTILGRSPRACRQSQPGPFPSNRPSCVNSLSRCLRRRSP